VDPRTSARVGERLPLVVDPLRLHFFDSSTGASLLHHRSRRLQDPVAVAQ
jgi:hypothetical protein